MQHSILATRKVTIGLDLGDRYSYLMGLDQYGEVVEEGRVKTTREALEKRFGERKCALVIMEAGTHSPWVSELIGELGHQVVVANPRELRLIYKNHRKRDRVDALYLARLGRADLKLLSPVHHRGEKARRLRAVLKARDALTQVRTKLMNSLRCMVKSQGGRVVGCTPENFHRKALDSIPEDLLAALRPMVEAIGGLTQKIKCYDKQLQAIGDRELPELKRLRQVKGVGLITSLAFAVTVEDPSRFPRSRTVGSYFGLVPKADESGASRPQLRISKAGDSFMRRLLVTSAHYILGPFGEDSDLRRFGEAIAARGGKNAKKRAVVAVARKLAVLLHRLWVTGEKYDPLRNTKRREARDEAA